MWTIAVECFSLPRSPIAVRQSGVSATSACEGPKDRKTAVMPATCGPKHQGVQGAVQEDNVLSVAEGTGRVERAGRQRTDTRHLYSKSQFVKR